MSFCWISWHPTFSKMTICIMTISITTPSIMTLGIIKSEAWRSITTLVRLSVFYYLSFCWVSWHSARNFFFNLYVEKSFLLEVNHAKNIWRKHLKNNKRKIAYILFKNLLVIENKRETDRKRDGEVKEILNNYKRERNKREKERGHWNMI